MRTVVSCSCVLIPFAHTPIERSEAEVTVESSSGRGGTGCQIELLAGGAAGPFE